MLLGRLARRALRVLQGSRELLARLEPLASLVLPVRRGQLVRRERQVRPDPLEWQGQLALPDLPVFRARPVLRGRQERKARLAPQALRVQRALRARQVKLGMLALRERQDKPERRAQEQPAQPGQPAQRDPQEPQDQQARQEQPAAVEPSKSRSLSPPSTHQGTATPYCYPPRTSAKSSLRS